MAERKAKAKCGRPLALLDEAKQREVCAILAMGCSRRVAAEYVGCSATTIRRQAQRSAAFRDRLAKAETHQEMAHVKHVAEAAQDAKNWRAAAWLLERRYPERYAAPTARRLAARRVEEALDDVAEILRTVIHDEATRQEVLQGLNELGKRLVGERFDVEA